MSESSHRGGSDGAPPVVESRLNWRSYGRGRGSDVACSRTGSVSLPMLWPQCHSPERVQQ